MTFFFFLSKTHLAGLWQIRQVHLLESKGCTFSVTRMHITFGYLANLKKKKKKKWKCQVTKLARSWMSDNKTQHKNFNLPESPAVRSELESEPWRQVSKDDAFPRLFTSIYQRYNVSFLTTPCCNWQSSKLWKTCYLIKRRLQTKIKSGSLVGSYFEPPACFLLTRLPQLTLADVR